MGGCSACGRRLQALPALAPVDAVQNGGPDAPWHTLKQFVRLEINAQATIEQVLPISTAAQLDKLFDGVR